MPANVEIKARARDWDAQLGRARALALTSEELVQEDVFFAAPRGRLKLRILGQGKGSYLIYYVRPDRSGPKTSDYLTADAPDPKALRLLLAAALGEGKVVRKRRLVLMVGQTRVHFDEVEGLGRFLELEVCLREGQSAAEGQAVAHDLMRKIGISPEDLLEGAYADMQPEIS
jgi:predicted adenylyl cyclase CyaB